MEKNENEIYGMRIVPNSTEKLAFGGFEGVVINSTIYGFEHIEISRMVKTSTGGYFTESFIAIPFEETLNSNTAKKAKFDFLKAKAEEFAKEGEEIAITNKLAGHLILIDAWWERFQAALAERE